MDFTGSLIVRPRKPFDELAREIGHLLSVNLQKDTSGKFDEFPAFVGSAYGIEIALLGIPDGAYFDEVEPVTDYSIIVRSKDEAADDDIETDLSVHFQSILHAGGIDCLVGNA